LEIHPSFLGNELQEELLKANQNQLHLETGVQCLNEKVQQAIGRRAKKEDVLSGIKFLSSIKLFETHTDLIFGLPEQTFEMVLEDVSELLQIGIAEIQLEVLKVLPGTPLVDDLDLYCIKSSIGVPYEV
jgi:coproporphyrinogen III oxidase-like Fe-S oxidoreductase